MVITKRNRQQQGYLSKSEAARLCGVRYGMLHYHVLRGHLPVPTFRLASTNYYTREEVLQIMDFFTRHVKNKQDGGDDFSLWRNN